MVFPDLRPCSSAGVDSQVSKLLSSWIVKRLPLASCTVDHEVKASSPIGKIIYFTEGIDEYLRFSTDEHGDILPIILLWMIDVNLRSPSQYIHR